MSRSSDLPRATARPAPGSSPSPSSTPPTSSPPTNAVDRADQEITSAFAAGDRRRALDLAMRHYGDRVYHYCRRMVGEAEAADVQQRVFIDVYRGLSTFDGRSTVRTWAFAIARHRCIDLLRRRERRREHQHAPLDDADDLADDGPDADDRLIAAERHAALRACIDKLAPAARSAVLLRYQEGFAYEAMASICDEQAGTLGRRVSRALIALRTCVERRIGVQP